MGRGFDWGQLKEGGLLICSSSGIVACNEFDTIDSNSKVCELYSSFSSFPCLDGWCWCCCVITLRIITTTERWRNASDNDDNADDDSGGGDENDDDDDNDDHPDSNDGSTDNNGDGGEAGDVGSSYTLSVSCKCKWIFGAFRGVYLSWICKSTLVICCCCCCWGRHWWRSKFEESEDCLCVCGKALFSRLIT